MLDFHSKQFFRNNLFVRLRVLFYLSPKIGEFSRFLFEERKLTDRSRRFRLQIVFKLVSVDFDVETFFFLIQIFNRVCTRV